MYNSNCCKRNLFEILMGILATVSIIGGAIFLAFGIIGVNPNIITGSVLTVMGIVIWIGVIWHSKYKCETGETRVPSYISV